MTRKKLWPRRCAVTVASLFVVQALAATMLTTNAHSACNLIPGTKVQFDGSLGALDRPFAGPGEPLEVSLRDCDADESPGFSPDTSDSVVTVLIDSPTGERHAVLLAPSPVTCANLAAAVATCEGQLPGAGRVLCVEAADAGVVADGPAQSLAFRFPATHGRCNGGVENGSVCIVTADCPGGTCDDSGVAPSLSGPTTIVVHDNEGTASCGIADCSESAGALACVGDFFQGAGACSTSLGARTFGGFTALPAPNAYSAACVTEDPPCSAIPEADELRAGIDVRGNLLLPFTWDGIRALLDGEPAARLVRATIALQVPITGPTFVTSYSPEGRRLDPVFEPKETGGDALTLFGSADAPYTILRIARGSDTGKECKGGNSDGQPCNLPDECGSNDCKASKCNGGLSDGGTCRGDFDCVGGECGPKLFDFSPLLAEGGRGPAVFPRTAGVFGGVCEGNTSISCSADCGGDGECVTYKLEAGAPVPVDDLVARDELADFAISERIDGTDRNGDGDGTDLVITTRDPVTGELVGLGAPPVECGIPGMPVARAVMRTSQPPVRLPAGATEGNVLAFLESESGQNACDMTGDGDTEDGILRVFTTDGTELTAGLNIGVDPLPVVNDRPIVVSGGRVFFRSSEVELAQRLTERASVADDESQATAPGTSDQASVALDGTHVFFVSTADDLVPGDTNGSADVFYRNLETGETERFSVSESFAEVVGDARSPVAATGRGSSNIPEVLFESDSDAMSSEDSNGFTDIYRTFSVDGVPIDVRLLSLSSAGTGTNGDSFSPSYSLQSGRLAFASDATNLDAGVVDNNGVTDIFMGAVSQRQWELVSLTADHELADGPSINPAIGPSSFPNVAFESTAANMSDLDDDGFSDVYVRKTFDFAGPTTTVLISRGVGDVPANGNSHLPSVANDIVSGFFQIRWVAFESDASNLVVGDSNASRDVFVHDRVLGTTERVSVVSGGAQANDDSFGAALSDDGNFVAFFSHANNLVGDDTNGAIDVFLHNRTTRTTTRVNVTSAGVQSVGDVTAGRVSVSDEAVAVAFDSAGADLAAGDTNAIRDVFVRRVDPSDPGGVDALFPDGVIDDSVLRIFDAQTETLTTVCPTDEVQAAAGRAVFTRDETEAGTANCPAGDLDGDGFEDDTVLMFVDGSEAPVSLGFRAVSWALTEDWIFAYANTGTSPGKDPGLNVRAMCEPIGSCDWSPVSSVADPSAEIGLIGDLQANGSLVAFGIFEGGGGARGGGGTGTDFNGDDDTFDTVLQVYDADLGGAAINVGLPVADIVVGDRVEDSACGSVQLVAFSFNEGSQGNSDSLNSPDTDTFDDVLFVYDVVSDTVVNARSAVTACAFPACDPRTPFRVEGTTVFFLTDEQGQGNTDLNGDGIVGGLILQTFEFCSGVLEPLDAVDSGSADPLQPQDDSTIVLTLAGRCDVGACDPAMSDCPTDAFCEADSCDVGTGLCTRHAGVSCVEDLDCARCILRVPGACASDEDCRDPATCEPQLVTAVTGAGDLDRDGILDGQDNCLEVANSDQGDDDGDGVGNVCDAATCADTPVGGCTDPGDGKGKISLKDDADDTKDKLKWKWGGCPAVPAAAFGNPLTSDSYELCVYDGTTLVASAAAEAARTCGTKGKPCWKSSGDGFKYKDKEAHPTGMRSLGLKGGDEEGKAKLKSDVRGPLFAMPALDGIGASLTVQLVNRVDGSCYETEFSAPYKKQDAEKLKAQTPAP